MNKIKELKPELVFHYFDEILQIPRPSKKEEKIIAYLVEFAKKQELACKVDKVGNVLISKKASPGYENRQSIALQSHTDMVCEKNADKVHDFDNDPIDAYVDGDWIKTTGTTLGADDGIGVAAALAVLADKNLQHGPIECLFTMDEETGMTGAINLEPNFITSPILLNLDSEDEGQLFIGCAGGMDTEAEFSYTKTEIKTGSYYCRIAVSGLNGGHSGDEIDKKLGNSIKILTRFLRLLSDVTAFQLSEINGGNLRNAIPREANAVISVSSHEKEQVRLLLNKFTADVEREFIATEKKIKLSMETVEKPEFAIDETTKTKLLSAMHACHHGVFAMSQTMPGLVETSSNLASVKMKENNKILVATSQRSSIDSAKENMGHTVSAVFELAGAKVIHNGGYPGWEPNPASVVLKTTEQAYKDLFGKEPQVRAIHAGLECGMFLTKFPGLDMVSFGPDMKGAHSPDEKLNIPSVQKFWDLLLEVLKRAPVK
jgi:dipeptidase D